MARPPVRRFAPRSPEPSRDRDAGTVPAAEERRCRSRVERSAGEETAVRSSDQRVRRHKAGGRCHVADRPHRANVKDGVQAPRTGGASGRKCLWRTRAPLRALPRRRGLSRRPALGNVPGSARTLLDVTVMPETDREQRIVSDSTERRPQRFDHWTCPRRDRGSSP